MLDTLKTLCYLSGVSGYEDEVRDYILERAMPYADSINSDAMGNLIVFKRGAVSTDKKLMLCAHMDEVGLIITGYMDDGFLRFACVGGIDRRVLIGKRVFIGNDRISGIIGIKPIHLTESDERKTAPKVENMYIDIGCTSREEAEKLVSLGDFCSFDDTVVEFGNGWLKAKAIDDRVGCAALLKLIESELPCDCWFVFSVQEELGARGALTAANALKPDVCLIIEGTTATDMPGVTEENRICTAGNGVVLPFMDRNTVYDRDIYSMLCRIADENGIKWQTKHRIAGGTDASAVQRSCAGVKTGAVSCAVRNIHSPASLANINEAEDILKLVGLFLQEFAEKGIN